MKKASALLKVVSLLMILFGGISAALIVIGLLNNTLFVSVDKTETAFWLILIVVIGFANLILAFVSGIFGLMSKHLELCKMLTWVLFVLSLIGAFIPLIIRGIAVHWNMFAGVLLSAVYLLSIRQFLPLQRDERGLDE